MKSRRTESRRTESQSQNRTAKRRRNNRRLVGAAKPYTFNDGTELWLTELGDREIIELDEWVRSEYIRTQREANRKDINLTEDEADRAERIMQETAATLQWYTGLGLRVMVSVTGMSQIIFVSARKRHPELKIEKVRELLLNKDNLDLANEAFADLNPGNSDSANPQSRGRKKKTI